MRRDDLVTTFIVATSSLLTQVCQVSVQKSPASRLSLEKDLATVLLLVSNDHSASGSVEISLYPFCPFRVALQNQRLDAVSSNSMQ